MATLSFGYGNKILLPIDDAMKVIEALKSASILKGHGNETTIEPFDLHGQTPVELNLVNEIAINKMTIKKSIGG
tara:strand:+ start:1247 stop:1468 length:222 start_codon:yes stop_codon:yes gene_type:complete